MDKMFALCVVVVAVVGDRDVNLPPGRSLLQSGAATSVKVAAHDYDASASAESDNDHKSITSSLDLYVKIMEHEVTSMREKMKVVEEALGVSATRSTTGEKKAETAPEKAPESLQQVSSDPAPEEGSSGDAAAEGASSGDGSDPLKARILQLETHVADLLSRASVVESELGVPKAYLLQTTDDPLMGMVNRAIALHVKVHDLHGRTTSIEHTVLQSLKPDATLLTKEVETLEVKVKTLKTSVQGPSSLLSIQSTDGGLKTQVSDLETRVAELLSTTTMLETELHGTVQSDAEQSTALLQRDDEKHGLVPRMSSLKSEVASLKSRVFTLEHHITG